MLSYKIRYPRNGKTCITRWQAKLTRITFPCLDNSPSPFIFTLHFHLSTSPFNFTLHLHASPSTLQLHPTPFSWVNFHLEVLKKCPHGMAHNKARTPVYVPRQLSMVQTFCKYDVTCHLYSTCTTYYTSLP